jgi:regulator of sigma E protease
MFTTLVIFTAVLSVLVFVHEFGHFITAKKAGIKVEEFGFGFPPRAVGIKRGETIYSLNWIPLGGFVRIKGETGEHSRDKDSFGHKGFWTKTLVLTAGVIMNFLLAWVLLSFGYLIGLPQVIDGLPAAARVRDAKIQVVSVLKGSPADEAGLQPGDTVLSLDGQTPLEIQDVQEYTASREGLPVRLEFARNGELVTQEAAPRKLRDTGRPALGVALVKTGLVSYPWYLAPVRGMSATLSFTREIIASFASVIADLVSRREVGVEFSGPVGIAVATAQVADLGFRYLLQFTALLSVNLAIINVLPIPALDGGRLLFIIIGGLRGRAVGRKLETAAHNIGFILLMILVLVVTYRDLVRFGDRILQGFARLFGV